MLRVYGVKTDPETGEIIQDRTLVFRAITPESLEARGRKTAEEQGYTITEVWKIGTLETRWANIRIA